MKQYRDAEVISAEQLAEGIYSVVLQAGEIAAQALPGQFVCVYSDDKAHLLPRPISICDTDREAGTLRLVYRVVGFGTDELSRKKAGDSVRILGPIGTGYEQVAEGTERPVRVLIGGGIGSPPMLLLAKEWSEAGYEVHTMLGFRNRDTFLLHDFWKYGYVHIATDDGSVGVHGTVVDAIREEKIITSDNAFTALIAACGPMPMLRGVANLAKEQGVPAYISLEERMACGVGACLGCIVKTRDVDEHSHVHNKRICTEGPVFNVKDLML